MKELTIARAIRWLLGFQILIGLALVAGDLGQSWDGFALGQPDAPDFDAPVREGDQRRRYDPARLPVLPGGPDQREAMPGGSTLPDRLTFLGEGERLDVRGAIAPGDAARFTEALSRANGVTLVSLNSPGGSVNDALDIGRQIRNRGLDTAIPEGAVCLSACPYILAGGTARTVDATARVGVHQHYFGESSVLPAFLAVEDVQRGQGLVMAHLDQMGVDPLVMQHALTTPPDEIYILLPEELERYRLVEPQPDR